MKRVVVCLAVAVVACSTVRGKEGGILTKAVSYRQGDQELEGFLARPEGAGPFPAVLVCPAWRGIQDHERDWTERLARLGYVALAADIYGVGNPADTREEAMKLAGKFRGDRALLRARAAAGLDALRSQPGVDGKRCAAIGFCFGGGTALELARSGADLVGVVSLHGNLDTPDPADAKNIRGRILALTGAADPHVPMSQVDAFVKEMEAAKVDYEVVLYGGAVHAFTDPSAGDDPSRGAAYDERAARRAWESTERFLASVFSAK